MLALAIIWMHIFWCQRNHQYFHDNVSIKMLLKEVKEEIFGEAFSTPQSTLSMRRGKLFIVIITLFILNII